MKKILIQTIAILIAAYLLPGVYVSNALVAIIVALVLAFVQQVVKPIFILLTLPITFLTLGLFLLFVNAIMIKFVAFLVPGFAVSSLFSALVFSLLLTLVKLFLEGLEKEKD